MKRVMAGRLFLLNLLLMIPLLAIPSFGQTSPSSLIANVGARTALSLDGNWNTIIDLDNAKAQLRDVIARDQNRAAIGLWSMSNETPISPERTTFLKALAEYARQLDTTRLITSAMNRVEHAGEVRTFNDPLGESLDVLGLNQYIGWYEGRPEDADRAQWEFACQKPVIISEFGGGAQYGLHGDSATRFTEEYQANLFQHQIAMLQRMPGLAGMTPWVLMDFRSPRRFLPGIQDYYNRKGLISDRGQKKQAFYVLQKFYREKQGKESDR